MAIFKAPNTKKFNVINTISPVIRKLELRIYARPCLISVIGFCFSCNATGAVSEEVSPEEAAHAFYGLLDGLSYETSYYDMDVIESHGEAMWKVFWRGVRA